MRRTRFSKFSLAWLLVVAAMALPRPGTASVYKWVDENGVAHYTTDRDEIPDHLRDDLPPEEQEAAEDLDLIPPPRGEAPRGEAPRESDTLGTIPPPRARPATPPATNGSLESIPPPRTRAPAPATPTSTAPLESIPPPRTRAPAEARTDPIPPPRDRPAVDSGPPLEPPSAGVDAAPPAGVAASAPSAAGTPAMPGAADPGTVATATAPSPGLDGAPARSIGRNAAPVGSPALATVDARIDPPSEEDEIRSLTVRIEEDRELLKELTRSRDGESLSADPRLREIAERLPRLQAQLEALRRDTQ